MAVSKRLRYEIFRRDNHTCRYCGATAPDVELTVDHVIPAALGGRDEPKNLVTACADCNAGKTSTTPDAHHIEQVADDAARWAKAMGAAVEEMGVAADDRERLYDEIDDAWFRGNRPGDWTSSIDQFLNAGLPQRMILDLVHVAQDKTGGVGYRWAYFCGCCWRRIRDLQDRAAEIAGMDHPSASAPEMDSWVDDFNRYIADSLPFYLGKALPADADECDELLHEKFGRCPIHSRDDCADERCAIARMMFGAGWATTASMNLLREMTLKKSSNRRRRQGMKTAYRQGFEDAMTGRPSSEDR